VFVINLCRSKEYAAALLDANKCIEIDPQWTKGFSRKGDALFALGKYTDAYNAYNSALRINPNDSTLNSKRDQAQQAISNAAASSGSSRSSRSSTSIQGTIQNYLRFAVVLCTSCFSFLWGSIKNEFISFRYWICPNELHSHVVLCSWIP